MRLLSSGPIQPLSKDATAPQSDEWVVARAAPCAKRKELKSVGEAKRHGGPWHHHHHEGVAHWRGGGECVLSNGASVPNCEGHALDSPHLERTPPLPTGLSGSRLGA